MDIISLFYFSVSRGRRGSLPRRSPVPHVCTVCNVYLVCPQRKKVMFTSPDTTTLPKTWVSLLRRLLDDCQVSPFVYLTFLTSFIRVTSLQSLQFFSGLLRHARRAFD